MYEEGRNVCRENLRPNPIAVICGNKICINYLATVDQGDFVITTLLLNANDACTTLLFVDNYRTLLQ